MDRYTIIVGVISLCALVQRLLCEDVQWFPTLKSPARGIVVSTLASIVAPVLDAVLNGTTPWAALVTGLVTMLPTLLTLLGGATANKDISVAMSAIGNRTRAQLRDAQAQWRANQRVKVQGGAR